MYGRHQIKQNKLSTRQSTLGILREVDSRIKTKKNKKKIYEMAVENDE